MRNKVFSIHQNNVLEAKHNNLPLHEFSVVWCFQYIKNNALEAKHNKSSSVQRSLMVFSIRQR